MEQVKQAIKLAHLNHFDMYPRFMMDHHKLKNSEIVFGICAFLYLLAILGLFRDQFMIVVSLMIPIALTINAEKTQQKEQFINFTYYWILLSISFFLRDTLDRIPLYATLQPMMAIFLYHPQFRNSTKIFQKLFSWATELSRWLEAQRRHRME